VRVGYLKQAMVNRCKIVSPKAEDFIPTPLYQAPKTSFNFINVYNIKHQSWFGPGIQNTSCIYRKYGGLIVKI
jgi:hypothetical protein